MKETKKLYSIRILKSGILFYSKTNKLFEDYKPEYYLDFKNKLHLKQFKIEPK